MIAQGLGLRLDLGQQGRGQRLVAQGFPGVARERQKFAQLFGLASGFLDQGATLRGSGAGARETGSQHGLFHGVEAGVLRLLVEIPGILGQASGQGAFGRGQIVGGHLAVRLGALQQRLGIILLERDGVLRQTRKSVALLHWASRIIKSALVVIGFPRFSPELSRLSLPPGCGTAARTPC